MVRILSGAFVSLYICCKSAQYVSNFHYPFLLEANFWWFHETTLIFARTNFRNSEYRYESLHNPSVYSFLWETIFLRICKSRYISTNAYLIWLFPCKVDAVGMNSKQKWPTLAWTLIGSERLSQSTSNAPHPKGYQKILWILHIPILNSSTFLTFKSNSNSNFFTTLSKQTNTSSLQSCVLSPFSLHFFPSFSQHFIPQPFETRFGK